MNSRRDFLKLSAAVSAWAAGAAQGGQVSQLAAVPSTPLYRGDFYKVVGDQRYPESMAFVAAARGQGIAGHTLARGDISKFWLNELQTVWQQTPAAVAGLTDAGPLFCLEQLCGQYGLRVIQREPVITEQGATLVAWLIAPRLS